MLEMNLAKRLIMCKKLLGTLLCFSILMFFSSCQEKEKKDMKKEKKPYERFNKKHNLHPNRMNNGPCNSPEEKKSTCPKDKCCKNEQINENQAQEENTSAAEEVILEEIIAPEEFMTSTENSNEDLAVTESEENNSKL